jgi:hypothetical protein
MSATTRWVEYSTTAVGVAGDGNGQTGEGTRGFALATASVGDSFDVGSNNNRLYLSIDGDSAPYVTLASGTDLDPRFVCRDIAEKLHNLGKANDRYDQAQAVWENNAVKVYSGTLGASSSVTVTSGINTVHLELGFGTKTETGGVAEANTYNDGLTVSGTYNGFFDEIYRIVINKELNIGAPAKGGTNTYNGTITAGGVFNHSGDLTYSLEIDTTNGTTMGGGTGNVPTISWDSTGAADDGGPVELLYPDYWYLVGTKGLMVKFTDAVFNTCANPNYAYTIACTYPQFAQGANNQAAAGTALYIWGSSRGDDADAAITTSEAGLTRLGTRGLTIKFLGSGANFLAGDEWYVICTPPQPQSYNISNLNYGNVTVSTESPVKCVIFEIMSGAVEMSTVKFGLQSHGSFSHHNAGNSDTMFRFGTVGPENTAGAVPNDGKEWRENVVAGDIDADVPPSYLYATEDNLSVVADADNSEVIGNSPYMGMVSDPVFLNVKLGASEVGANSTINYRLYFDFS